MGRPASGTSGISRLDLAKMAVEDLIRHWRKMRAEHSRILSRASADRQRSIMNLGQYTNTTDQYFLLSTARQHPDSAVSSAARFIEHQHHQSDILVVQQQQERIDTFQRELKGLHVLAAKNLNQNPEINVQEEINYATGLNSALSGGLQIISRYRLHNSQTENFGMGRLPNCSLQTTNGSPALAALQPACLILVTDGACLRLPPAQGGGTLQLQFGSQPLRELYREPFRWDQRIFVLAVGGRENVSSSQYLHPLLRALCEVSRGSHYMIRSSSTLSASTDNLLKCISPPMPRDLPLPEPLFLKLQSTTIQQQTLNLGLSFINGGPVCCFQAFEPDEKGKPSPIFRAMLLYTSSLSTTTTVPNSQEQVVLSSPLWCIPESYFPNKKLDTLPPRLAQPLLHFSKYPPNLGSKSFEPSQVIKMLHRYDQMITINRKMSGQTVKYLHRDVYICDWSNQEGGKVTQIHISGSRSEYYPVFVQGAGRPAFSEEANTYLNIGILHVPVSSSGPNNFATLSLLPPEPHVLLPLLIRAAEMEQKVLRRNEIANTNQHSASTAMGGSTASLIQKQSTSNSTVPMDENWRSEFRAYLFRLPPYYQFTIKRCLRPILPGSVHSLLNSDESETLPLQCFSKTCLQKIRNGEQIARDNSERLERQESLSGTRSHVPEMTTSKDDKHTTVPYGNYDPRTTVDNYLASLRNLPPPWKSGGATNHTTAEVRTGLDILGDLPAECLMAYYESRRRWIFGGPGLTVRGLHVEGVRNDGTNTHRCIAPGVGVECALSIAGIGVSTLNRTATTKMGEYKERLLFSRAPVVGYGSNDAVGVAATTAIDGSPRWSVDDDALPLAFFDPETGEFADSAHARLRSKLQVNFGNPYKEKRADSIVPEKYRSQTPTRQKVGWGSGSDDSSVVPGSPPHDSFDSVEENEALFVRTSPSRTSPVREDAPEEVHISQSLPTKRQRTDSIDSTDSIDMNVTKDRISPPQHKNQAIPVSPLVNANLAEMSSSSPATLPGLPIKPTAPPAKPNVTKVPVAPPPPPRRPPPPTKQMSNSSLLKAKPPTQPKGPISPSSTSAIAPTPPPPPPLPPSSSLSKQVQGGPPVPPKKPIPPQLKNPIPPPPPSLKKNESSLVRSVSQGSASSKDNNKVVSDISKGSSSNTSMSESTSTSSTTTISTTAALATAVTATVATTTTTSDAELENPDIRPSIELPSGWITNWSKSKKRWYFFDQKSNKSVWNWPPPH